jgi:hypothetical protein
MVTDIKVKIAFDGATAANRDKRQMEVGTVELLLDEDSLSNKKSSNNCYPWLLYFGSESYSEMQEQIGKELDIINEWGRYGAQITIDGITYTIKLFLTVDLKCLAVLAGMVAFYGKAKYCCFWCRLTRDRRGALDLSRNEVKLKTAHWIQGTWETIEHLALSTRETKASENEGMKEKPLINIPPEQVVPCMLHLVMGVVRRLLAKTANLINDNPILTELMVERFALLHLHLNPNKKLDFKQRVKKSRFTRTEYLRILENHPVILKDLLDAANGIYNTKQNTNTELTTELRGNKSCT